MDNLEEIYRKNAKYVYSYVLSLTHNKELAEDITQETFYKASKSLSKFRGECKIQVWLCQIAKNIWLQCLKKSKIQTVFIEEIQEISGENCEHYLLTQESWKELYRDMQNLDELSRQVIYLRMHTELTFSDIGEILGKTENWARVVYYRAKIKLKEVMQYGK